MKEEEKQKLDALLTRLGSLTKEQYTRMGKAVESLGLAQLTMSRDDVTKAFESMTVEQHEQLAQKLVDIGIVSTDERDLLVSLTKERRRLQEERARLEKENAELEKELMDLRKKLGKKIFHH